MKKVLCLLLTIVMCVSLAACGETTEVNESAKPSLDVEQELVNICCDYSNCSSVKGFEIGTLNEDETDTEYIVKAKGSYWPVDEYGNIEDLMLFDIEFTATWNGSTYRVEVDKKSIREKY